MHLNKLNLEVREWKSYLNQQDSQFGRFFQINLLAQMALHVVCAVACQVIKNWRWLNHDGKMCQISFLIAINWPTTNSMWKWRKRGQMKYVLYEECFNCHDKTLCCRSIQSNLLSFWPMKRSCQMKPSSSTLIKVACVPHQVNRFFFSLSLASMDNCTTAAMLLLGK